MLSPNSLAGLNQQFVYHNFDCSIFINFQYGNKVYNDNKLEFTSGYTPGATLLGIMKNRWHTVDANGNAYESVSGTSVIGASPDSLNALNAGAKYWIPGSRQQRYHLQLRSHGRWKMLPLSGSIISR